MKNPISLLLVCIAVSACAESDDPDRVIGELVSDRVELSAEFSEPIVAIHFAEGASVDTGDVLLQLEDSRARARLAEAEAAYQQNKARLDELVRGPRQEQISAARANSEGARKELAFREAELQRTAEIHSRRLASLDELDQARAAVDSARAAVQLRSAQLEEVLAGTTVEELTQAEQVLAQSAARRDSAEIDLARHTIVAPTAGVLDSRLFEIGERPATGQPLLVVLAGTQAHARVYVPENIRVQIQQGVDATVHVDGIEQTFRGRVRWIASESAYTPYYALTERDRGRLSYVAKVDILDASQRLPDGVPVEVEFSLAGTMQ